MAELIITEKPNAAMKLAQALADGKPIKESINGIPYYLVTHGNKDLIVGCAVGHLFSVAERESKGWVYPVFDVEWKPTADVQKGSEFSKKYLNALQKLSKKADEFTVACDYDIEGEVIGLNIIKYICKQKDAARMKFSTLTKDELVEAYEKKSKSLDWGQAYAGETRHILDFFYGINLSRALTSAIKKSGRFKILSIGRVQGPALKIVVDREKEIKAFVPIPFWQISLNGKLSKADIEAWHKEDKFWEKEKADAVMEKVRDEKKGRIKEIKRSQYNQAPPVPFDLTALQLEAYRCFKINPKETLDHAQELYTGGYISYPRTSSQKLPVSIGYKKILGLLAKNESYKVLAEKVMLTPLKPNEGKKEDPAHPAIYPTGIEPGNVNDRAAKIYDLIVKRFFAVFAEPAKRETVSFDIDVREEIFITKGTRTLEPGWHVFYQPYIKFEEVELPACSEGDTVDISKIEMFDKETSPPKRYTPSSIIKELEKQGLGTKATRAAIVDTLFQRGYVEGTPLQATDLGIQTVEILEKYSPDIIDAKLTREFEEEMEGIRGKKTTPEKVLEHAKVVLIKILDKFKKQEELIGSELGDANIEAIKKATTIGKCPNCDGELMIRKGKFGRFIACNKYPDCKTTFKLPAVGIIKPTDKKCETCGMPMIILRRARSAPKEVCINPECPTKADTSSPENNGTGAPVPSSYPEEGMQCPNCKEGKMVLRTSFYGHFLGCNKYPKCKTMMKIVDGKVDTTPISPKAKAEKKAAAPAKATVKKAVKKAAPAKKAVAKKKAVKKK